MAGSEYTATRLVTQLNSDGMLVRVEVAKRVKKMVLERCGRHMAYAGALRSPCANP